MRRYYIFKDGKMEAHTATRESAIDLIRAYQAEEAKKFPRSEFSLVEGGPEEFIPYPVPTGTPKNMKIVKIQEYIIPTCGNKQIFPYGKLIVSDGENQKVCSIQSDSNGTQYILFNRKRFRIRNIGTLYAPVYEFI